jgi:hypothetical protein
VRHRRRGGVDVWGGRATQCRAHPHTLQAQAENGRRVDVCTCRLIPQIPRVHIHSHVHIISRQEPKRSPKLLGAGALPAYPPRERFRRAILSLCGVKSMHPFHQQAPR